MPQETLTVLQQNRLEAARERVLGFRNQVADGILKAVGLEKYGRENYSFHLGRIKAWDSTTTNVLEEMGLAVGGMMTVPALMIGAKDGDMDFAARQDRFRLKFKDWKEIPIFGLGFEIEDHSFRWLYDIELSTLSKNFDEQELKCLGISAGSAFGFTLAEEARFLFNKAGWLRTEKELEPLIEFMSRRVDLEPKYLSVTEKQRFTAALDVLKKNPPAIHDWLREQFGLISNFSKRVRLEGDIRGVVVQFASFDSSGQVAVIRLHDIVLPEPNSKAAWTNLVRPKAGNRTGTLKIIIYPGGGHDGKVERYGVEEKGYNTDNLLTTENLAAILAKIKAE